MTYNFDPERWYENNLAALEARKERGELDEEAFAAAVEKLEKEYERMLERLDGTYQLSE
jgi:hypothetical protein